MTVKYPNKGLVIEKWNKVAVKNALDDTVQLLLSKTSGVERKYFLENFHFLLNSVAVLIAIISLGYSYFHSVMEFPRVMTACIIAYFALISIAQLFSWYVIQNKILIAAFRKDMFSVSTKFNPKEANYSVIFTNLKNKEEHKDVKSIGQFIDVEGHVHKESLEAFLNNLFTKTFPECHKKKL
ncbi:signal peptidase complex subunit 2-like [Zophobas morio]|uniref:signal peptidase complex subunit 2-like n=1 Tax=Zophobas morio TaxID=2755281 RepID=UPI003083A85E